MKNRKLGRFAISKNMIENEDEKCLLALFSNLVIYLCEFRYDTGYFEYLGFSPLFRELQPNAIIPDYNIIVTQNPIENTPGEFTYSFKFEEI